MRRLLVGNLDGEATWSGRPLPGHVRRRISGAATLLRALAADGDTLWTPTPVTAARLPPVGGVAEVRLASGPLLPHAADEVLAWAATDETAALSESRTDVAAEAAAAGAEVAAAAAEAAAAFGEVVDRSAAASAWAAALWNLRPRTAAVARRANDRRFSAALASSLRIGLPGARVVTSVDELRAHLASGGADSGHDGAWVAKAPLSAAGRDRVRGRHGQLDGEPAAHAARLLTAHGALCFEPWLDRLLDLGRCGVVLAADHVQLLPPHRLHTDAAGGFRGITIDDGDLAWLTASEHAALDRTAAATARALAAAGYRGAFGIDAFLYRDAAGGRHLHPLCELNARLTFGLVARAWADRLGQPLALHLGRGAPADARLLLAAAGDDPSTAWVSEPVDAADGDVN